MSVVLDTSVLIDFLLGHQGAREHTIDAADLAIAATAILTGCRLLTRNIKHFPMFGLTVPYE